MSAEIPSDPAGNSVGAERLIEAISPALAAELGRMVEDLRASWEGDANLRLRNQLLEKETEFRMRLEEEIRQARELAASEVRQQVTSELENRFRSELAVQLDAQKARFETAAVEATRRAAEERDRAAAEAERWRTLALFHHNAGGAGTQVEILREFLEAASRFAASVALYVNKADGLALWKTSGASASFPEVISEGALDPAWLFAPIVVRGKTVAGVAAAGVSDAESIEALTQGLQRSIEALGLRIRFLGRDAAAPAGPPTRQPTHQPTRPASAVETGDETVEAQANARRLARMLVSEIKLGNEKEVMEGRARHDLYLRLQKAIEAGRDAYHRQIPAAASDTDYYHEELVKILADNDPDRMGAGYPGPGAHLARNG